MLRKILHVLYSKPLFLSYYPLDYHGSTGSHLYIFDCKIRLHTTVCGYEGGFLTVGKAQLALVIKRFQASNSMNRRRCHHDRLYCFSDLPSGKALVRMA